MSIKINWDDSEPTNNSNSGEVSQAEFLHAMFGEDVTRGCCHHISKKPNWTRYHISASNIEFNPALDCYYSVGSFIGNGNDKTDSPFMRVLVADDYPLSKLEEQQITPTYILQTSDKKIQNDGTYQPSYQVGFKITDGNNLELADKVMQALYKSGFADKSGNNRIRLARLPDSTNNKRDPFKVKLIEWNPSTSFSLSQVADLLELELDKKTLDFDLNQYEKLNIGQAVTDIMTGASLHDNINRIAMSQLAKGMRESDTEEFLKGIMISAKSLYVERGEEDRWQERFDDIERSVRTASKKLKDRSDPDTPLLIPVKQWIDKMVSPDWVIDNFIGEGVRTISGAAGKGKTSIVAPLCANVAHLLEPNFLTPRHRRVVFYFTEDTNQLNRMIVGMKMHQTREFTNPHDTWSNRFRVHLTKRYKAGDIEDIASYIKDFNTEQDGKSVPPLVVFDTQAASFDIEDENNNAELSKLISQLKIHFWETHRIPVWVVTHITKDSMSTGDYEKLTARGAGSIVGDSNGTLGIVEIEGIEGRILGNVKDRDGAKIKEVRAMITHHVAEGLTPYGEPDTIDYYTTEYFPSDKISNANLKIETKNQERIHKIFDAIRKLNKHGEPTTESKIREMTGMQLTEVKNLIFDLINEGKVEKIQISKDEALSKGWKYNQVELFLLKGDWEFI